MDYFDVRHVPDGFLRGQWITSTLSEAKALGRSFGHHAKPLFDAATPDHKFRLGFSSATTRQGKSTFIKSMLTAAYPRELSDSIEEGFIIQTNDQRSVLFYDQKRTNTFHALTWLPTFGATSRQFHALKDEASVHVAEWPQKDRKDPNYSALWRLQILEGDHREWSLYAPKSVHETPEVRAFLADMSLDNRYPS